MSSVGLQRVMVRMLYDAAFAHAVLERPGAALAGTDLTERERSWLLEPDPRAWFVDPDRPRRSLSVLLQEYPASFALTMHDTRSIEPLERFFQSPHFHACVEERGLVGLGFGDHLAELAGTGAVGDGRVAHLARLEQAIVRLRAGAARGAPGPPVAAAIYTLSPDKALHEAAAGTAELHAAMYTALDAGDDLTSAVLDSPAPPAIDVHPTSPQWLLLELVRDDGPRLKFPVGVVEITREMYELLALARTGRSRDQLIDDVRQLGAEADEAPDIIAGMIEDGTLAAAGTAPVRPGSG